MPASRSSKVLDRSQLEPYQEHAVEFLLERPRAALWQDMGLGKTVVTLTALDLLRKDFEVGNILVIAPKRVARKVWSDEIKTWSHLRHLTIRKILGHPGQRHAAMEATADIHTINFDNLVWLIDHFKRKGDTRLRRLWPWDTVILDESSAFKNRTTERWQALRRVIQQPERVIELTGTPAPNGLIDTWAPLYFLDYGARLGRTLTAYRERWFEPPGFGQFRWKPYPHSEQEIHKKIADLVLAMREEDYLDLPPVMMNTIRVELSPPEREKYRKLEKTYWIELGGAEITAANAGVLFWKLLQLANGALYVDDAGSWIPFHDAKLEALREIVRNSLALAQPVMVFHNLRSDIARIRELMSRLKVTHRVLDTEQDEDDWNAGKIEVLSLHPGSAGHGLNLQDGGETIVWYGLNPSLELYQQANARLAGGKRREGKNIRIHHIVTEGTVDEDVMEMLANKDATQERLFLAMKRRIGHG